MNYFLNKYFTFYLNFIGKQRWTAADRGNNPVEVQYNAFLQNLGVSSPGYEPVYFLAPGNCYHTHFKPILILY